MSSPKVRSLFLTGLALLLLHGLVAAGGPSEKPVEDAALQMDRVEERTEELANSLLEMADALLSGQDGKTLEWLDAGFSGDLPLCDPGAVETLHTGYTRIKHAASKKGGRAEWLAALRTHVKDWTRVEDARLKVKSATFPTPALDSAQATIALRLQGVGPAGSTTGPAERRAATVLIESKVRFTPEKWKLESARILSQEELRGARPAFADVTGPAGLTKRLRMQQRGIFGRWHGACTIDIDNDGLLDIFVPSMPDSHLYRNLGDGTFADVAGPWGINGPIGRTGAVALDYDNDGLQDLFVCAAGRVVDGEEHGGSLALYRNTGKRFEDVSVASGIRRVVHATSASVADYDGDGLLDIFVCCYNSLGRLFPDSWLHATNGQPDLLFHNLGGGKFEEVGEKAGVADKRWGFAAAWGDYDGDGRPDLYVANDWGANPLYRNEGNGKFRDVAEELGVSDFGSGMGAAWGDYDGDGQLDLYVANMSSTAGNRILRRLYPEGAKGAGALAIKFVAGNSLFRRDGAKFADETARSGTGDGQWAWGTTFLDADNDGWLDLFVTNGFLSGRTKKDT